MQILLLETPHMRTILPFAFSLTFHLVFLSLLFIPIENQLISAPRGSLKATQTSYVEFVTINEVKTAAPTVKKESPVIEGTVPVKSSKKKTTPKVASPQVAAPSGGSQLIGEPNGTGSRTPISEYLVGLRAYFDERKVYPPMSRRMGETGKVLVSLEVLRNGTIQDVKLKSGSRFSRLNEAALKTVSDVKKYKPLPDSIDGEKISVVVPIEFTL